MVRNPVASPQPFEVTRNVPNQPPLVANAPQSPGMGITTADITPKPGGITPPAPVSQTPNLLPAPDQGYGVPMPKPTGGVTPMPKPPGGVIPMPKPPGMPQPEPPNTNPNSPIPMQPTSATNPYAPPPTTLPGNGNVGPQSLQGFDNFADAAYQAATRRLDPRFEQMDARFRQDMINRGLAEGTEAYDKAFQNFSMDRNDAYAQAQNNALAQALAAQGQAFGQDFQNRGLNQQARQFGDSLGFQYAGLNEGNRQFNENMGFNNQRADMQDLMALLGFGQNATLQNNQMLNQDFNRASGLFGLFPGMQPTQVDAMTPYQMQQNAWLQQSQNAAQQSNGMWGALGQIGSAFITSDERLKTDIEQVGTLDNGLPVYLARYVTGGPRMLMLMAQDVLKVKPEAVADMGGFLGVNYEEALA